MKFRFKGCWHCGEENHSRKPNDAKGIKGCPKFEALKAKHGGKLPDGYKGAYEKARDAAWEKAQAAKKNKSGKVLALEADDDSEFDSDEESPLLRNGIFALTDQPSFSHPNPFDDLAESDDDDAEELPDDIVTHFSKWAKVKTAAHPKKKKKNAQSSASDVPDSAIRIASLKEFEKQAPKLASSPANTKKLQRALKKLPQEIELENDEVLCLIDTGSTVHAANAQTHFSQYVPYVKQTKAQLKGGGATTACGGHLPNKCRFIVNAIADGHDVSVPFTNMDVQLPILSARQMTTKGSPHDLGRRGWRHLQSPSR